MKLSEINIEDLRDLDFNDAGSWPLLVRMILFALVAAVIAGMGYQFLISDQVVRLQEVQNEEKDLRAKLERKQRKVATLDALKAQVERLQRDFASLRGQLPGKTEVASLLREVSQTRVITGLEEELFKPLNELPQDFYAELPIQLRVRGTYHQLGEFVSGIAALPRIVTLHNIKIIRTNGSRRPSAGNRDIDLRELTMTATAKTYRYRDDDEISADEEVGK